MTFSQHLIEQAKSAKSSGELLDMAKDNGVELTADEAQAYFAQLHPASAELDDDELDNVAGGGCSKSNDSKPAEQTTATVYCMGCGQTVQIDRRPPDEDIDSYFGVCPVCGKVHFNL